MNLDEVAAYLGSQRRIVVQILTALGIQPARITKSGRKRWGTLKSAQIRRVILEYNRQRALPGYRARQMRHRWLHLTGPERLERYYLMEKERNRKRAERKRSRTRPARMAGLAAGAAFVGESAVPDAVGASPTGEALQSTPQTPADGISTDPEGSGDLAL